MNQEPLLSENIKTLIDWKVAGIKDGKPYIQGMWVDSHGARHFLHENVKYLVYTPQDKFIICENSEKFILDSIKEK